jgi:outer membrane lipoprotein-sorting protein
LPGGGTFAEDKSDLPFSTQEPEVYQAEIVVTAASVERVTTAARNGARRRYEYDFGEKTAVVWLKTDKSYLLLTDKKMYAEQDLGEGNSPPPALQEQLTNEWLYVRPGAKFESLGTENKLKKYSARLNESDASEIILFVDEATGLPVKQEYYSVSGDQKDLLYSVELRNLRLEAGDDLFTIPKDYRKVSEDELRKALRSK